jgi:hypothetical protein
MATQRKKWGNNDVVDNDALGISLWVESLHSSTQLPRPACTVPGLVLVAEWGWADCSEHLKFAYSQICEHTISAGKGTLFCKPAHASHITIALLSSFKRPHDSPRSNLTREQDEQYLSAWVEALNKSFEAKAGLKSFQIEAYKIEVSPGAAIILFKDESGTIDQLRSMVEDIISNDDGINELDEQYEGKGVKSSVFIPNIIHSSYARFTKSPANSYASVERNINNSSADEDLCYCWNSFEEFKEEFESRMMSSFQPFKVQINRIVLANETSPYMHQEQNEESTLFEFELKH